MNGEVRRKKLSLYGAAAADMIKAGLSPFIADDVIIFWAEQEAQGFPAVHHSKIYEQLYHPAYRVVARKFLEEK
jgi:hypothetical protein